MISKCVTKTITVAINGVTNHAVQVILEKLQTQFLIILRRG